MNVNSLPFGPWVLAVAPAVVAEAVKKKSFPVKTMVGGFLYAVFLAAIGLVHMGVATALAWVIAITSVLVNGQTLFTVIGKAVS